jgi:hypothetical protein
MDYNDTYFDNRDKTLTNTAVCPQIHARAGRPRRVRVGDFVQWSDFRGRVTAVLIFGDSSYLKVATITLGGEVYEQFARAEDVTDTCRPKDMFEARKLYSDGFLDFTVDLAPGIDN